MSHFNKYISKASYENDFSKKLNFRIFGVF